MDPLMNIPIKSMCINVLIATIALSTNFALAKDDISVQTKPNIVIFYVDDLGYGDISSYGATSVNTPNIDELAKNGIRFTDAHSSSSTCTPSRYSLLTGEHAIRNKAQILKGDAPLIISVEKPTLPKMLSKAGYTNAVIGKWHLGLGDGNVDWNNKVSPGPLEIGFDYSFLLPATGDRTPTVYLENHHVLNLSKEDPLSVSYIKKIGERPTGENYPALLKQQTSDTIHNKSIINGVSRMGWMKGGKSAEWKDEDFYSVFTNKANQFIEKNKKSPFFLFFSFHDIHVPRLPNKMFQGKTDMGPRGDAIVQMDWITGQIVNKLKSVGILDNTLVIFTSDNGAVVHDGYYDDSIRLLGDHKPNGIYRGSKYSAYEAGTRVPTIIHYPNAVKPGVSDALMSQIDIYASLAKLVKVDLAKNEAIDSENHLAAFFDASKSARRLLIEESPGALSLRENNWKYIQISKRAKKGKKSKRKMRPVNGNNVERGYLAEVQLFNLETDVEETINLAKQDPKRSIKMKKIIQQILNKTER